ncbi:nicotinate-nucleotide-dimethylbenzimidazole phosphoribosyltransferase [Hasllibacter halocynthiae]|uniref:Nicotinate-nucleotide--dimethylbenzimidazole phosphoribosyltransferase n=1 Tax=Hasllibacter halocynthiae TaxID=595589 RepID=A0A2T0X466_9RHOB|nr:nicotinate-nucleotide--dimethylbenzimidazole phosphoribosyltransferase [Hasllibacter halocynthiae]PRY93695.1 nicotinate-nucleotide-dimethylbenzimidazole phosphoribosyltransferase [Hasllibacter halocynthiae]
MDVRAALSAQAIQAALDGKTKPPGSLGRIEGLAAQVAALQGTPAPRVESCRLLIFAADHGMAALSAFPQEVTRQMVGNFLAGGAAASVFARAVGAEVTVVDAGVAGEPLEAEGLVSRRIGAGTADAREGPAMSADQVREALEAGRALGAGVRADAAAFGEMGIGNTASAALVAAKLLGRPVGPLVGRGTGLDDAGLARKRAALEGAAGRCPDRMGAVDALREYGGFEIAMMAGAMLGAARARRVVLVDGFIAGAAAASALDLDPGCREAMVFCHRSAEAGHGALLEGLGAEPLLDLALRLGEGTGALLAFPLVRAAAAMLAEMASFEDAGVSAGPPAG